MYIHTHIYICTFYFDKKLGISLEKNTHFVTGGRMARADTIAQHLPIKKKKVMILENLQKYITGIMTTPKGDSLQILFHSLHSIYYEFTSYT